MKYTALDHPYVYVVLEHHIKKHDAKVHGVYTDQKTALGKVAKLIAYDKADGYLCVLKKTVEGKKPRVFNNVCKEFGLDEYVIEDK